FAGEQIAGDDAARLAIDQDDIHHLMAVEHPDRTECDLAGEGLVGAEQQLLAGLSAGVKGPGYLDTPEGPGFEEAAIFAGEGNPLRNALVNGGRTDFRQSVDVGLAGAVVPALDRIVKQPVHTVA